MNESYAEAGISKNPPFTSVFLKVLLVVGLVFSILLAILGQLAFFAPVAGILAVVAFYAWPRLSKLEYEYIFCDGQIDFDQIKGGAKRKTLLRIDMENVEVAASPERAKEFDREGIKTIRDFSKIRSKAYLIITSADQGQMKIYFDPTDKMVDCMYNKAPSKVKK